MNEISEEWLQRLSAYMDGQGDADERAAVETELRSQPIAAEILQSWRDQGRELKSLYRHHAATNLPNDFADRVVHRAIEQACQEGCDENHPLILAGQSPCLSDAAVVASRTWKTRQRLLVVAFVAASVMAMAWLGIHGMSGSETPQQSFSGKIAFVAPWDDAGDDAIQNDFSEAVSPITPEIEIASNAELALDDPAEGMPPKSLFEAELSVAEATQTNTVTNAAPVQLSPQPTDSPLAEPAMTLPPTADPNLNLSIGMLLVVEVKCLDGVDRNALMREATQWARIDANAEYEISDDMVGVAEEVVSSEAPFQMIFLNAPARSLDRLHLRLASDKDRVESIGLTVANDVQLVGLSDSINQDPSLIRDTAVAVQITGESGMDGLADLVDSLTFLPVTNGDLSLGGQSMTASGPDELAQILFIVR